MFTTPTKTPKFRLRPYDSPMRPSPGGPFFPLSPPLTASPFKTPSPRRLNLANPFTPSPKGHRVGIRTPSLLRKQRLSPGRKCALPLHLNPEPGLSTIIEETSAAVQKMRLPLNNEERIYWNELERLGALHSFNNALADARENVHRGAKDGLFINAEIDAQSQVHFPTKAELEEERKAKEAKAERKAQIKREHAIRKSLERRAQREREEKRKDYQEKLAEKKRQRIEREQRAQETLATPRRSRDPPSPAAEPVLPAHDRQPMQADQDLNAHAAPRMPEKLEAARLAAEHRAAEEARARLAAQQEEAQARLAAQQEEARLQEEAKRLKEERFRVEMERSQAAKARRRAEEERVRAEMEFAQAEEEIRKAEEVRQWAERQREERLRAMQEEARLAAQRKTEEQAQRDAVRKHQEARIQAERDTFFQQQEEMRRIAEQAEVSFSERMLHLEALKRLEEAFEERVRAQLEQIASYAHHPRNPLAEFYIRQAAQRAAEQERAQQQYEQGPPADSYSGTYQSYQSSDIPMREPSMDASMHSVCDDTPYADEPLPAEPQAPPQPPTIAERFAIWEAKWKAIDSTDNLFTVAFHQLPWPVLHDITSVHDITPQHITEFLSHSDCPRHLTSKRVVSYYHPDKFKFRVMHKMHPDQQIFAAEIANHCTVLLVNHMR